MSVCERLSLCVDPLRVQLGFQQPSVSLRGIATELGGTRSQGVTRVRIGGKFYIEKHIMKSNEIGLKIYSKFVIFTGSRKIKVE